MYGVRDKHRHIVLEKINKAIAFQAKLFNVGIEVIKEWSHSPFINPKKYFAQFQNQMHGIHQYGYVDMGFIPIFLTVTLPSEYHRLLDGETYEDMIYRGRKFLSESWRLFRQHNFNKKVRDKYGKPPPFYKVPEPMKSGVPHLHCVIYIPKEFYKEFYKLVKRHFSGHTKIVAFFKKYKNGVHGVMAYVAKYVSKLVRSLEMDDVGVWYCYHRFRLFTCSRTLCPLYIHRKIKRFECFHSLYDCTKLIENGSIHWNFDKQLLRSKDIGILHFFPAPKSKKDLCSDMRNSESWQRHIERLKSKNKEIVKFTTIAHFGKDSNIIYAPIVPFAKMSLWELNTTYKRLRSEYNPFVDFELDRLRICEREYKKRFEFD